jgi:hypothetical protein
MSRFRASVALASLVTSLVMTAGVTTLSAEAASAAPNDPYPPTAPALTVNRGTVRVGGSVVSIQGWAVTCGLAEVVFGV